MSTENSPMATSHATQRWRDRKQSGQALPLCPCCQVKKLRADSKNGMCSSCYRKTDEWKEQERLRVQAFRAAQKQS